MFRQGRAASPHSALLRLIGRVPLREASHNALPRKGRGARDCLRDRRLGGDATRPSPELSRDLRAGAYGGQGAVILLSADWSRCSKASKAQASKKKKRACGKKKKRK